MSATKTPNPKTVEQAKDLMLRAIAALVNDKPQDVIAILKQFERPIPANPTNVQLADEVSKGFGNAAFMGALMVKANDNFKKYMPADGYDMAAGGGKAAAPSGNMIGDIANAIGNVALASAQITASVEEVKKAKVENKSKLLDYVTSADTNKTSRQIAQIQAAAAANVNKKDNTVYYIGGGVVVFMILIGAVLFIKSKSE